MAISTQGVPLVKLPTASLRRDTLRCHDSRVGGLGRQSVNLALRRPDFSLRMAQSESRAGRHCQRQSSFLMRVSAVGAQTVKEKAHTTVVAPMHKKTPSLDNRGNGNAPHDMDGTGGTGRGGWGGWGGGGGGGHWGPSSGGLILFGILFFLSYLKDVEKAKDDEEENYDTE